MRGDMWPADNSSDSTPMMMVNQARPTYMLLRSAHGNPRRLFRLVCDQYPYDLADGKRWSGGAPTPQWIRAVMTCCLSSLEWFSSSVCLFVPLSSFFFIWFSLFFFRHLDVAFTLSLPWFAPFVSFRRSAEV
ncbi:hypothetical protein AMAG_20546 [Allomyces macrogynus ATCC 38327]|uniref:Uncharacterized protein n=1 Tax=Allomyces macrogynus (strain ATCC 38327) TaxID=578462 RepID=A0A0L0TC62_ALLM3|nr:hypothetical protein AMAG_20546 [Allomyces macrogynus ATCC 38327]|eukprot:KNE72134.1 hypothetical protein AMAG_20546 [Allomyces macrogynus ATCC 38327]